MVWDFFLKQFKNKFVSNIFVKSAWANKHKFFSSTKNVIEPKYLLFKSTFKQLPNTKVFLFLISKYF